MKIVELMEGRRSVRSFTERRVSREDLKRMIDAALTAPSSKNSQSSGFVVTEEPAVIERLSQMREYGSSFMKSAPLVVLVTGDEGISDLWQINASISATYLQLAAESLGLGSCWVQIAGRPHRKDDPEGMTVEEYVRGLLPVPEGHRVLCAVAIGYPSPGQPSGDRKIRSPQERVIFASESE